jgi:hypothetical protein
MRSILFVILATQVLWVAFDSSARAQATLPDDVRQALPAARPSKASPPVPPVPATPPISKAPVAAAVPADSGTETTEQLLAAALLRYRNIIDQGADSKWEADVAQRLDHLEAILKKLKDEAHPAASVPPPAPKPKKNPPLPPVPSTIVPTSAVEPVPAIAAKPTAPVPHVVERPKMVPEPLPKSAITDPSAVETAVEPSPAVTAKPSAPAPYFVERPKTDPGPLQPSATTAPNAVETAKELEKMATTCQQLAQELRAAAARLRDGSGIEKTNPPLTTKR